MAGDGLYRYRRAATKGTRFNVVIPHERLTPNFCTSEDSIRPIQARIRVGVADIYQQEQQKQRKAAFQKGYADAYASGDREQMRRLFSQYPEEFEEVRKGMGYVDDAQRDDFGNLALKAQVASSLGAGAFGRFMMDNEKEMRRLGVPPEIIADMHFNDPQGFQQFAGNLALFSLGHEKYFDVKDAMEGRDIERGKLTETIRSNQAGEALQWANHSIAKQNAELRRLELKDKMYDRLIAKETNAIKLADLQDKRIQNQQATEQAKRDREFAYNTSMDEFGQVIDTANKVLNSPGFTGYFGININPLGNRFIPGTDAASTSALVDTLKSQGFMANIHKMKGNGSLSNAEGQKVMDAIGSLSPGQSEKSARAAIKTIIKTTEMAQKRMQQKYGKDMQPQQLSDDELINKYLGG